MFSYHHIFAAATVLQDVLKMFLENLLQAPFIRPQMKI